MLTGVGRDFQGYGQRIEIAAALQECSSRTCSKTQESKYAAS